MSNKSSTFVPSLINVPDFTDIVFKLNTLPTPFNLGVGIQLRRYLKLITMNCGKYYGYTKKTQKLMYAIDDYLVKRFGNVKPEWLLSLNMLADDLDMYDECKKAVKENGIFNPETGAKNPLLATMKDYQASITKIIQHLGISPYASAKIETPENTGDEELLKALVGNGED